MVFEGSNQKHLTQILVSFGFKLLVSAKIVGTTPILSENVITCNHETAATRHLVSSQFIHSSVCFGHRQAHCNVISV